MSAVGVIFSNIHDENVPELSNMRTMGSIPYGGRYRLIDFALSNLVNSGVTTVGIITKNNYQSLMDHLGSGKDWDLARKTGGLVLLPPFGAKDNEGLYKNRLEALKSIIGFLTRRNEDYVILCDCDGVYRMDFSDIIDYHEAKQADITLVCHTEEIANSSKYTLIKSDAIDLATYNTIAIFTLDEYRSYSNEMIEDISTMFTDEVGFGGLVNPITFESLLYQAFHNPETPIPELETFDHDAANIQKIKDIFFGDTYQIDVHALDGIRVHKDLG